MPHNPKPFRNLYMEARRLAENNGINPESVDSVVPDLIRNGRMGPARSVKKLRNASVVVISVTPVMVYNLLQENIHPVLHITTGKYKGSFLRCTAFDKNSGDDEHTLVTLTDGKTSTTKKMKDKHKKYEIAVTPVHLEFKETIQQAKPKKQYKDVLGQVLNAGDIVSASYIPKLHHKQRNYQCITTIGTILTTGWPAGKIRVQEFGTKRIFVVPQENCTKLDENVADNVLKYKLSL